jgi:hypothetical protein
LKPGGAYKRCDAASEDFTMTASLIFSASIALIVAQNGALTADQAKAHIGETATVEGRLSISRTPAGETYLDIGGSGSAAPFSAYVSRGNSSKFQDMDKLNGKNVRVTGQITTFRGKPEIFVTDPGQIAIKLEAPAPAPAPKPQ